jgi:hypothetical protein
MKGDDYMKFKKVLIVGGLACAFYKIGEIATYCKENPDKAYTIKLTKDYELNIQFKSKD